MSLLRSFPKLTDGASQKPHLWGPKGRIPELAFPKSGGEYTRLKCRTGQEQEHLLDQMPDTLDAAIEQTQTQSIERAPPILEAGALGDVLDWIALRRAKNDGLPMDVETGDNCTVLRKERRSFFLRLGRDFLFNVVKHANAEQARLQCQCSNDRVVLAVIDDGDGLVPDRANGDTGDGFGLNSVRERLEMIGGQLDLESAPGEGRAP